MKIAYQGLWYSLLLIVQCVINASERTDGIYDSLGYSLSDDDLHITITAPHIFINPRSVPQCGTFKRCTIQLHSGSDAVDVSPVLEYMSGLTALSIINTPFTQINFFKKTVHASITQMEISNTKIIAIACDKICTVFPQLKSLIIKNNSRLESIVYPIHYHQNLTTIDLSGNALKTINLNKLLLLSAKLECINISDNPLVSIEWIPDDFVAHYKVPEIVMKNISIGGQDKEAFLNKAATDNKVYLWMKTFMPAAFALSFAGGFFNGSNDLKMTMLMSGVGMPIGYLLGRLVVDKILFPNSEDKRLPYFKPVFE